MLGAIRPLTLDAVRQLLAQPRRRNISSIHVHHTWRPSASQWRGRRTVEAMRRVHMQTNRWSDIAQHITLGPDGSLWSGRHIDRAPASAVNHNGSGSDGPFMIEMVGDFDVGRDPFADPQAAAAYALVAVIRQACGLGLEAVRFHNELSPKSCPGTSIDLDAFRAEVDKRVPRVRGAVRQPVQAAQPVRPDAAQDADGEPTYDHRHDSSMRGEGPDDDAQDTAPTAAHRAFFERHVVNIAAGRLSDKGHARSTPQQLDALVASLLAWAGQDEKNRNVLLWAHGGLVSERDALDDIVLDDGPWWLANGVYPIFFVWETGWCETIRQMLRRDRAADTRGLKDDIVEWFARHTLGPQMWQQMKDGASLASEKRLADGSEGGGYALATRLAAALATFAAKPRAKPLRLHMAGHSAGAVFASHFVPTFSALPKAAPFETLTLLAPALRVDRFKTTLAPMMAAGGAIKSYAQFGMKQQTERDDKLLGGVYGQSLLYLVRNACERDEGPLLGLEESIAHDPQMQALWDGNARTLILSPTGAQGPRHWSESTTHQGFDEDQPTMEAVARRVLDWPDDQPLPQPMNAQRARAQRVARSAAGGAAVFDQPSALRGGRSSIGGGASRRDATVHALCIGIDAYTRKPLGGCVADMQAWARAMQARGAVVRALPDGDATKQAIVQAWREVADLTRPGDTFVVQFAGHGTQVPDQGIGNPGGGDETYDSAWVPIDGEDGELLVDDEIGALIDAVPQGVRVVLFTDCCHSGTSTRARALVASPGTKVRFLPLLDDGVVIEKYLRKRAAWAQRLAPRAGRTRNALGREIHFAACQDHQLASERDGHGDFTRAAMQVFDGLGSATPTCQAFHDAVKRQFVGRGDQQPNFRAQPSEYDQLLWAASGDASGIVRPGAQMPGADATVGDRLARIDTRLDELERLIRRLA